MEYQNLRQLIKLATERKKRISEIVLTVEAEQKEETPAAQRAEMLTIWRVMQQAIKRGLSEDVKSLSGLSGGDGKHLANVKPKLLSRQVAKAAATALAVGEVNAAMGRIVACPTAGSCGIVPAALAFAIEQFKVPEEDVVMGLFTAAGVGIVCSLNASISGAEGGCQAECGVAAAMAAAALTELGGGTPEQVGHAVAICLTNMLGLVCDPVAGLVEIPCILRNAGAIMQALLAAELALADIESRIPADEVIGAMHEVGEALPESLRETAKGGLANTPTGKRLRSRLP